MAKPPAESMTVEEQFLLQSLHRLPTPELRYAFTMMADLISHGLAAEVKERKARKGK